MTAEHDSGARRVAPHPGIPLAQPLSPDPEIQVVRLRNGLTAWLRQVPASPGRIAVRLHLANGSLVEEEAERGFCHFLEHLAFRATANFPPGALIRLFESLGTRLGRDHNAYTRLDRTVFALSFPDASRETIDKALLCLADIASRQSLLPDQVDSERKVILEEIRAEQGAQARINRRVLRAVFPGSRIASRHPLGTEEALRGATPEALRSFYRRWYRPDRATLLMAGDLDPEVVAPLIEHHLGRWSADDDTPVRPWPAVEPYTSPRAAVVTDSGIRHGEVRVVSVLPYRRPHTVEDFRSRLVEQLGVWIFDRRLRILANSRGGPFHQASASLTTPWHACHLSKIMASGSPDVATDALALVLRELDRVEIHGFLEQEVEDAKATLLASARRQADTSSRLTVDAVIREMTETIPLGRPPISRLERLNLSEGLSAGVHRDQLISVWCDNLTPSNRLLLAILPSGEGSAVPEERELLRLTDRDGTRSPGPPAIHRRPRSLLERQPEPGAVETQDEDPDLGILSATFANGARVHFREMGTEQNRVFVTLTLGGGRIRETADTLGTTGAAALAFLRPSSHSFDSARMRDFLAAATFNTACSVDEDCIRFSLSSPAQELEKGLELAHLLLTQPRVETGALEGWRARLARRRPSVELKLAQRYLELLSGHDPRFALVTAEKAGKIGRLQAQEWLDRLVRGGPLEAAMVGDLDRSRAVELALRYLGSLPARPLDDPELAPLRELRLEEGPLSSTIATDSATPRAALLVGWRASPWQQVSERRTFYLVEQILSERLTSELRERRGLTYHANCSYRPSRAYPQASSLEIGTYVDPDRVEETLGVGRRVVEAFASDGPTEEEAEKVRSRVRHRVTSVMLRPRFWSRTLADLAYHGARIDDLKDVADAFLAIGCAEIRDLLQRRIGEEGRIEVVSLPSLVS